MNPKCREETPQPIVSPETLLKVAQEAGTTVREELVGIEVAEGRNQAPTLPGNLRGDPVVCWPCSLATSFALSTPEFEVVRATAYQAAALHVFELDTRHSTLDHKGQNQTIGALCVAGHHDQVHQLPRCQLTGLNTGVHELMHSDGSGEVQAHLRGIPLHHMPH